MLLHGLERVLRAGRPVPARRRQHGGDEPPVHTDSHRHCASRPHLGTSGFPTLATLIQPAQGTKELLVQLLERCLRRSRAGRDHEITIIREALHRRTEDLLQTPSYVVALHRTPDLFRYRETQPRSTHRIRQNVDREQPSSIDRSLTVDPLKLGRSGKTRALTPGQRLDGQPFTPFAPARGDDLATTGRAHALAETVGLGPLATVRLVGALHRTPSRNLSPRQLAKPVYPNQKIRPTIPGQAYPSSRLKSSRKYTRKELQIALYAKNEAQLR